MRVGPWEAVKWVTAVRDIQSKRKNSGNDVEERNMSNNIDDYERIVCNNIIQTEPPILPSNDHEVRCNRRDEVNGEEGLKRNNIFLHVMSDAGHEGPRTGPGQIKLMATEIAFLENAISKSV